METCTFEGRVIGNYQHIDFEVVGVAFEINLFKKIVINKKDRSIWILKNKWIFQNSTLTLSYLDFIYVCYLRKVAICIGEILRMYAK